MGLVTGPHARTPSTHSQWVVGPRRSPKGRGVGGGRAPDPGRPTPRQEAPPPGALMPPPQHTRARTVGLPTGPHARTPSTHSQWPASPGSPPRGRAAGRGTAPDPRRPSKQRTAPPPGTPFRHYHGAQRWPARARAVGPVLGAHARTDCTRDTRVGEPWLPAPEDKRPGEGQLLTPEAPHNGGRLPPRGRPPTTPTARSPQTACRPRGQCWAPTPTHPRPQQVGGGPQQPAQWAGSLGRDSA